MSHSSDSFLINHPNRLSASMHPFTRVFRKLSSYLDPLSVSELLLQLEEVTTPAHLTRTVNRVQNLLWKLPTKEQGVFRQNLVNVLCKHVLQGAQKEVRLEAAGWLRLFVQAGQVTQPADIFVTLVTAAVRPSLNEHTSDLSEQRAYLRMIFDCFWPFRHPYAAFSWEQFPANCVFFPLATLLPGAEHEIQEALLIIFAELPTLDEPEITTPLLPIALRWAKHNNPEYRRLIAPVLARMQHGEAQAILQKLQSDTDVAVRASAHNANNYSRP